MAERRADGDSGREIETEDGPAWCYPQLAGAAQQRVPGRPASVGDRLLGEVGAERTVRPGLAVGTWPALRGAAAAVGGAAAEVPGGEGRQPFFSASSSRAGPR